MKCVVASCCPEGVDADVVCALVEGSFDAEIGVAGTVVVLDDAGAPCVEQGADGVEFAARLHDDGARSRQDDAEVVGVVARIDDARGCARQGDAGGGRARVAVVVSGAFATSAVTGAQVECVWAGCYLVGMDADVVGSGVEGSFDAEVGVSGTVVVLDDAAAPCVEQRADGVQFAARLHDDSAPGRQDEAEVVRVVAGVDDARRRAGDGNAGGGRARVAVVVATVAATSSVVTGAQVERVAAGRCLVGVDADVVGSGVEGPFDAEVGIAGAVVVLDDAAAACVEQSANGVEFAA